MFERKSYEIILQAVTPIAHASETQGNMSIINRLKVLRDGIFEDVPVVSGDAMRHGLRQSSAMAFLDAAGFLDGGGKLNEASLRLLFSGGIVSGKGDAGTVKLDQYHEMTELVPMLSLLGGCCSNRVIPGKITVENAMLICDETLHLLPEWVVDYVGDRVNPAASHVVEEQRVRMDPTLVPSKVKLLSDGEAYRVRQRLLGSEAGSESEDAVEKSKNKSTMLPRSFETICAGSLLFWKVNADCQSQLEIDTFNTMVLGFLRDARVGGKQGTGFGHIKGVKARDIQLLRPKESSKEMALVKDAKIGELFRSHVEQRKERISTFLSQVDA